MQFFTTRMCNVTAWRDSRLHARWPMDLVGGGAEGEVCILRSLGIVASPISLSSMGGVCGRSLTAGKIHFTGRQTCSLYLVLWLCVLFKYLNFWKYIKLSNRYHIYYYSEMFSINLSLFCDSWSYSLNRMNKWNSTFLCTPQKQVLHPDYLAILDWENEILLTC